MSAADIIEQVAIETGISVARMLSPSRYSELVRARRIAARRMAASGMCYMEIGRHLNRHHSSVMNMLRVLSRQRPGGNA